MLSKNNFLDLIRNFIVFEPVEGRVIKKLDDTSSFDRYTRPSNDSKQVRIANRKAVSSGIRRVPVNPCPWSF